MDKAAAQGTHTHASDAEDRDSGKRQKRAALTAVTHTELTGQQPTLPITTSPSSNQESYEHLLHWNRNEEDEVLEWDKASWGQYEDEEQGQYEDEEQGQYEDEEQEDDEATASHVRDTVVDVQDPSEGPYDDLDAAETAIRQITQQPQPKKGRVAMETVVRIINESMETFANQWSPVKYLELAPDHNEQLIDPVHLWEDAEALGRRDELVKKYTYEIRLYESKLDILATEICKIPQNSENQVRQHCRNLEMHVHNLEAAKWYLSIYELPPAGSEPGSAEEETLGLARGHVEVIDLESSSDSSDHGDDREICVDAAKQVTIKENAIDAAGTMSTPYQKLDGEMIVDHVPTVAPYISAPRTLTLTKIGNSTSEPGIVAPIEPEGNLSAARHTDLGPRKSQQPLGNRPEVASILTVSGWNMRDLIATKDSKRVVMKVMLDMSSQQRDMIHQRIRALKKSNLLKEISTCIDMLYRKEQKILGVLPSDLPKIRTITNFFLCWWFADNYMYNSPTDEQLHELATELHLTDDLELFYDWVHYILHKTFSKEAFQNAHAPSQEEIIVISDDEEQSVKSPSQKKPQPTQVHSRRKPQDDIVMLDTRS